jgi:hypothetical protein
MAPAAQPIPEKTLVQAACRQLEGLALTAGNHDIQFHLRQVTAGQRVGQGLLQAARRARCVLTTSLLMWGCSAVLG